MSKKFFQIITLSALIVSVGGIGAVQAAQPNPQQVCEQANKKWNCLGPNATGDCCKTPTSVPAFAPGLPPVPMK
ncbi:MAG: hypothetical protein KBD90_06215 [Alphaproteobacteria bacterium]|nr:hypothetical protein [Alphaproteobacteria bacterium]